MSAFETSGSKDRDVTRYRDDVDITIAAGEHPFGQDILYREGIVSGNVIETFIPSTDHSLTPLQVGISTTPHGQCWQLKAQPQAMLMTQKGMRIDPEAFKLYQELMGKGEVAAAETLFKRVLIPETREEAAMEAVRAQFPDMSEEMVVATIDELPSSFFDTLVYQKRGARILDKDLAGFDEGIFTGVSNETIDLLIWAFEHLDTEGNALDVIENARQAFGDFDYDFVAAVGIQRNIVQVKGAALYNALPSESEEPVARPNWGLPSEITDAYKLGKRKFGGFIAQVPFTRERVGQLAIKEWGVVSPFLSMDLKVITYDDVSTVILAEEQDYSERLERWQQRNDASTVWMNLGDNVKDLSPNLGSRDARPRPTISHELPGDVDVQMDALERDLLREVTPKDKFVRLGDALPWSDMLPYYRAGESGRFVGHPLAYIIDQMLSALAQPYEPLLFKGEAGDWTIENPTIVERLMVHTSHFVHDDYIVINNELAQVLKVHTCANNKNGFMEATVQILQTRPDHGYLHVVSKSDFDIMQRGVRVLATGEAVPFKVGDVIGFASQPAFVLWRASLAQVPTLTTVNENVCYLNGKQEVELKLVDDKVSIGYTYKPIDMVFPIVWDFLSWAKEEYDAGAGYLKHGVDVAPAAPMKAPTPGSLSDWMRPTDMVSWLQAIQNELTQYQNWCMGCIRKANMPLVEDWVHTLISAYDAVAEDPAVLNERFEDANGQRTSLFGMLTQNLWATMKTLTPETMILPRPMKLAFSGKDASGEPIQVWKPNNKALWAMLGYAQDSTRTTKTEEHLVYMVKEQLLRSHPQDLIMRREWVEGTRGKSRMVMKRLVDASVIADFSTGLLGDMLANWWAVNIGLSIPSVKGNFLAMGLPALKKAFPTPLWPMGTAERIYIAGQQWSRMKSSSEGLQEFISWLFQRPGPVYETMGKWEDGQKVFSSQPNSVEDILRYRIMFGAPNPQLSSDLIEMALEVLGTGDEEKRLAYLGIAQVGESTLGKETAQAIIGLLA